MDDADVEAVARAINKDLLRQDGDDDHTLPDDLCLSWLDQGYVNLGEVAQAAITTLRSLGKYAGEGECVVPKDATEFDCTRYPSLEEVAILITSRIAGRPGKPPKLPDPVQVLEDASSLFKAAMTDYRAMLKAAGTGEKG